MNRTAMLAAVLAFAAVPLRAQDAETAAPDPVAIAQQAISALPNGPWNGRLDKNWTDFHLGGWQSLKSLDQAYGVAKPVWSLNKGEQPLLNLGFFAGVQKPLDPLASSSLRVLAGETIQVPGSALDWALGTKMGSYWLPKAKAGLLIAHDWTRPSAMHLAPDFVGLGLTWLMGGAPAK